MRLFEKRRPKNFRSWCPLPLQTDMPDLVRHPRFALLRRFQHHCPQDKSFLLLFSKKEALSFLLLKGVDGRFRGHDGVE